jgi:uncharacterized Fe-S cluster-containing MiaB family protein
MVKLYSLTRPIYGWVTYRGWLVLGLEKVWEFMYMGPWYWRVVEVVGTWSHTKRLGYWSGLRGWDRGLHWDRRSRYGLR